MSQYYKRDGTPCSLMEWAASFENSESRIVEQTTLENGKWVSTVFLGLDHSFGDGPCLIFETMVFPSESGFGELDMKRYSTEEQAMVGHAEMVKEWSGK